MRLRKIMQGVLSLVVIIQFFSNPLIQKQDSDKQPFGKIVFELDEQDQKKLDQLDPVYKIALLADSHAPAAGKAVIFQSAVKKVKELNPDLILFLGDMVESDRFTEIGQMRFAWDNYYSVIKEFIDAGKVFPLAGNHEAAYYNFNTALKDSYVEFWQRHQPKMKFAAGVYTDSYALEIGDTLLIMLFTPCIVTDKRTLNWLKQVLQNSNHQFIFLFTHRPIELIDPYPPSFGNEKLDPAIIDVIKNKVTVVFSGHLHVFGKTKIAGTKIPQYQIGAVGGKHKNVGNAKPINMEYWSQDVIRASFGLLVITKEHKYSVFYYKEKMVLPF